MRRSRFHARKLPRLFSDEPGFLELSGHVRSQGRSRVQDQGRRARDCCACCTTCRID